MRMLDLFSGIGGFALAAQRVWGDDLEIHAFCEKDEYCQRVLKKHWPDVPIFADVRDVRPFMEDARETMVDNADSLHDDYNNPLDVRWLCQKCHHSWHQTNRAAVRGAGGETPKIDILTGGFPC